MEPATSEPSDVWLTSALRDALRALARRRVPEADVEDVVQTVLIEAATSPHRPSDPTQARKWLYGILRHKIADYHRRPQREELVESVGEQSSGEGDAQEVRSLLAWATRELPPGMDARRTLEWLLRESEGETLEEIARDAQLPADQVRQRVSRLRRFFKQRWLAQAAAAALLVTVALFVIGRPRRERPMVLPDHTAGGHEVGPGVPSRDSAAPNASDASDVTDATDATAPSDAAVNDADAAEPSLGLRGLPIAPRGIFGTSTSSTPRPRAGRRGSTAIGSAGSGGGSISAFEK